MHMHTHMCTHTHEHTKIHTFIYCAHREKEKNISGSSMMFRQASEEPDFLALEAEAEGCGKVCPKQ